MRLEIFWGGTWRVWRRNTPLPLSHCSPVKHASTKLHWFKTTVRVTLITQLPILAASIFPSVLQLTIIGASTCSNQGIGIVVKVGFISYLMVCGVSSFIITIMFSVMTHMYLKNNTLMITDDRKGLIGDSPSSYYVF